MTYINRSYSELIKFDSFEDRLKYLMLSSNVSEETFGSSRYLNQALYNSPDWKSVRRKVILRDNGCDMGLDGYELSGGVLIHHINPITKEDILNRSPVIFDMENLVCVSHRTHNAIHYGKCILDDLTPKVRTRNDTCPWKK